MSPKKGLKMAPNQMYRDTSEFDDLRTRPEGPQAAECARDSRGSDTSEEYAASLQPEACLHRSYNCAGRLSQPPSTDEAGLANKPRLRNPIMLILGLRL